MPSTSWVVAAGPSSSIALRDERLEALAIHHPVDESELLGDDGVEDDPAGGGLDQLGVHRARTVVGGGVPDLQLHLDRRLDMHVAELRDHDGLVGAGKGLARALLGGLLDGEVVAAQHHVMGRRHDRRSVRRRQQVLGREHQLLGFPLRSGRERHVDRHLVAVEVGVEGEADEGMDLDRRSLHQHRHEGLDPEPVQRRGAVQQHRVVLDHLFEHVPDLGAHALNDPLGALDVVREALLHQLAHDERLEQLERHLLGEAALVQLQLRSDHDHRAARVVDPLAEQVLAEPSLLALEHVRQALEPMVAGAGDGAAAAAVVDQRVAGLLQHPLLVPDDDLGRLQVEEAAEAVVAVDDTPIQVVQVAGGKAATVELHHRAQVGRDDRQRREDHPFRAGAALAEGLDQAQALDRLLATLAGGLPHLHVQPLGQVIHVELLDDLLDRLGAHAGLEHAAVLLGQGAELGFGEGLHDLDVGDLGTRRARREARVIGLAGDLRTLGGERVIDASA